MVVLDSKYKTRSFDLYSLCLEDVLVSVAIIIYTHRTHNLK